MLPGVPTSGFFFPAVTSGGSVTATGAGTTIAFNNGGYFELSDGTRYTCTSADGCTVANGTVTRGSVAESFGLDVDDGNGNAVGIVHANGRFYVVDSVADKVFAYSESGQRDAAATERCGRQRR